VLIEVQAEASSPSFSSNVSLSQPADVEVPVGEFNLQPTDSFSPSILIKGLASVVDTFVQFSALTLRKVPDLDGLNGVAIYSLSDGILLPLNERK